MTTHSLETPNICSNCGSNLDRATGRDDEHPPVDGDISICLKCANVAQFLIEDGRLKLKTMSAVELKILPEDIFLEIQKIQKNILSVTIKDL